MPEDAAEVTASMTLLEAVQLRGECEDALRARDARAGCCLLCDHLFDSIEHVAGLYGLDLKQLLKECNQQGAGVFGQHHSFQKK